MRWWRSTSGTWHRRRVHVVVLAGLAVFVLSVYGVVVLGVGALLGRTQEPDLVLSVLATAVVALGFEPVRARLQTAASRLVHGGTPLPYDVLTRFSEPMSDVDAAEDLAARMAKVLAEGTGARWAQVWLTVHGRPTLAATWPTDIDTDTSPPSSVADAEDASKSGRRSATVRHSGQVYGVFRLQEHAGTPLSAVEQRLFAGLAAQAGLVLRLVSLRADLAARHGELRTRAEELTASRQRVIQAQDAERRRLERDIHDGAQQHLVALAVNLRLAETVAARAPERAAQVLSQQAVAARVAIENLSELSRGIYPRLLAAEGVVPALRAAVETSTMRVAVEAEGHQRPSAAIEAALYFVAMEAVQNAAKHSGAGRTRVRLVASGRTWQLTIDDDGHGFDHALVDADPLHGNGLANMRDRLDTVGGTLSVTSVLGAGTTVVGVVPVLEHVPHPRPAP